MLVHKPESLSWVEAASIPEVSIGTPASISCEALTLSQNWITATQAMYLVGEYRPKQSILWHAGASSVSIAGIQLSKADNASAIYVTASSQEKIDFCVKELGATAGFNYKTQDWSAEVQKATNGEGVDVIIDYIGAPYFQGNVDAAARDAHMVMLGLMGGSKLPEGVDIGGILRKRLRVNGTTLRSRDEIYQGRLRDMLVEHALPKFETGEFKILVEKVFPFTGMPSQQDPRSCLLTLEVRDSGCAQIDGKQSDQG